MIPLKANELEDLFGRFSGRTLAVLGDVMLDHYVWGRVRRISPEAPVPVVDVESESHRLGGASNVALNVACLGSGVLPVGVIGQDQAGDILTDLLRNHSIPHEGLIRVTNRPTSMKTRIIAHSQHVTRIDREVQTPISGAVQNRIIRFLQENWDRVDGIVLEDYNKGVLTPRIIQSVIKMALDSRKPVFVDPKALHFFEYKNVTVFKPNRKEILAQMHAKNGPLEDLVRIGMRLRQRLNCEVLLVTLGEQGMIVFQKGRDPESIPTRAKRVHDVSGAGDTVIATMAVAMTAGAGAGTAAVIANFAAGIVCEEVGTVPIEADVLKSRVMDSLN